MVAALSTARRFTSILLNKPARLGSYDRALLTQWKSADALQNDRICKRRLWIASSMACVFRRLGFPLVGVPDHRARGGRLFPQNDENAAPVNRLDHECKIPASIN